MIKAGLREAGTLTAALLLLGAALPVSGPVSGPMSEPEPEQALAPRDGAGWELVWSDEFDGTALDRTKWTPEVSC